MSEFYPTITKPLRGARAFKEVSETASQPRQTLGSADVQRRAKRAFGFSRGLAWPDMERAYRSSAERLYAAPTVDSAAELMAMRLAHPRELVRIAAAHAYLPLTDNPARRVRLLAAGVRSADRLEAELAATSQRRMRGARRRAMPCALPPRPQRRRRPDRRLSSERVQQRGHVTRVVVDVGRHANRAAAERHVHLAVA